jgi:hypothetical protein
MKAIAKSISLMAILVVLLAMTACDNNSISTIPEATDPLQHVSQMSYSAGSSPVEYQMFTDNNQTVGYISVSNDRRNLYVTLGSSDGWLFAVTNLQISANTELQPKNNQPNPSIDTYAVSEIHRSYISEYTYQIPLNEAGFAIGTTLNIIAKADLVKYDPESASYMHSIAWGGSKLEESDVPSFFVQYTLRNPFRDGDGSIVIPKVQISANL